MTVVSFSEPPADPEALRKQYTILRQELERVRSEYIDPAVLAPMVAAIKAVVKGDLAQEIPGGDGATAELSKGLNRLVKRFRASAKALQGHQAAMGRAADGLNSVAKSVNDSAVATFGEAETIARSASTVDSQVQHAAGNVDELSQSIGEIADRTSEAAAFASEGVQVAEKTTIAVERLGASTAAIDKVIKVISGIAQQTNLLALNATIEAARAGSAGRGFAVVATEVKDLARETATATTKISEQIEAIQGDSRAAAEAIEQIAERIMQIAAVQEEIAVTVDVQRGTVGEIADSVRSASAEMGGLAEQVGRVAERAKDTEQATMDVRVGVGEMKQTTVELGEVLGRFQV